MAGEVLYWYFSIKSRHCTVKPAVSFCWFYRWLCRVYIRPLEVLCPEKIVTPLKSLKFKITPDHEFRGLFFFPMKTTLKKKTLYSNFLPETWRLSLLVALGMYFFCSVGKATSFITLLITVMSDKDKRSKRLIKRTFVYNGKKMKCNFVKKCTHSYAACTTSLYYDLGSNALQLLIELQWG